MAAVLAQELVSNKIQRRCHVAATINICKKVSTVVDQESVDSILLADKPEFFHRSRRYVLDFRNHCPPRSASFLHSLLVAQKNNAPNDESDDVGNKKESGQVQRDGHDRWR